MKLFSYTVKNSDGKVIKGVIEAESQEKVIAHFHKQNYIIFAINETKKKQLAQTKGKVSVEDLVVFSRQFTTLIESGIPVVECLSILEEQSENVYFKKVISDILKDVREGASLCAALSKHRDVFPEIYVSMVEAAEVSGNLPAILDRVSMYLEKSNALRKKVTSALYYPVVVVLMAFGITAFLLFKVVPTFKDIFAGLGKQLPLPTRVLLSISDFVTTKEFVIGALVVVIIASIAGGKYFSTAKGRRNLDRAMLGLPVFGELMRRIAVAKFSRTFSTLVRSGVSIVKCLDIVGKTSGNKIIEDAVVASKKAIQEGQPISVPLEKTGVFPVMVIKMIAVGEKSGRLEDMLTKIAEFYEAQTDAMVSGLSSLVEPVVIAFLGIIVGGIVIALFMPIITITQYL